MSKIVVGVDGSHCSDVALSWARREAAARGWDLTAVLTWDYLNQAGAGVGAPFDVAYDESAAREALAEYIERAPDDETAGVAPKAIEQQVVCDLPANGLISAAAPTCSSSAPAARAGCGAWRSARSARRSSTARPATS